MSVLPHGGGWVGLAEFQGGWVSNPPPPPGVGWDFVGALGSIEPVPLLSFFCCRFHVTCLFMVCLHGIAYHVCMPHAHKGARMHCHLCQMRRGNAKTPQLLCLPHAHKGYVGGWVGGCQTPPPPWGGVGHLSVCGYAKILGGWVPELTPPPPGWVSKTLARHQGSVGKELLWSMGLGRVFEAKLPFTRDVYKAKSLPQGLHPPAKPVAKPPPTDAATPRAKPSGMVAAKPAASEPIPLAPVNQIQLSKVKDSHQRKWHTEPIPQ